MQPVHPGAALHRHDDERVASYICERTTFHCTFWSTVTTTSRNIILANRGTDAYRWPVTHGGSFVPHASSAMSLKAGVGIDGGIERIFITGSGGRRSPWTE